MENLKGGVMDIQRQAFETIPEIAELYAVCKKRDLTISEREFLKGARCAWQQARKVAVPEGFVLVPKEPTEAVLETLSNNIENARMIYKAVIEAVEQSK